jgi:hypothetical protein
MDDAPSLAAWLALAVLWAAVALGFAVGARARGRAPGPTSLKPTAAELPDRFVVVAQQASLLACCAPAVAAVLLGAGAPAILWWAVFALPASVVLASLATPPLLSITGRETGAEPPGGGAATPVAQAGALVCVPAVAVVLLVLGTDSRVAVAAGLIAGYGLWRAAYAARTGEARGAARPDRRP